MTLIERLREVLAARHKCRRCITAQRIAEVLEAEDADT